MKTDMRTVASYWHSGQSSPMYAFCSTGTIVHGLEREARECMRQADNMPDVSPLEREVLHDMACMAQEWEDRNSCGICGYSLTDSTTCGYSLADGTSCENA